MKHGPNAALDTLHERWALLLDRLVTRGLLTPQEASEVRPRLDAAIDDQRTDPTAPLPPLWFEPHRDPLTP